MYESCFISWWGRKDKISLTYIETIKIRLHKSNLYFCIYVNGWLYDCNNKLEPLNVGTNCSTEQITKLWEAMQCL